MSQAVYHDLMIEEKLLQWISKYPEEQLQMEEIKAHDTNLPINNNGEVYA